MLCFYLFTGMSLTCHTSLANGVSQLAFTEEDELRSADNDSMLEGKNTSTAAAPQKETHKTNKTQLLLMRVFPEFTSPENTKRDMEWRHNVSALRIKIPLLLFSPTCQNTQDSCLTATLGGHTTVLCSLILNHHDRMVQHSVVSVSQHIGTIATSASTAVLRAAAFEYSAFELYIRHVKRIGIFVS